MAKWDKSQPGNSQPSSQIGTCLTLPNLGFLWVFFKYPKISKNGNPLFFPVYISEETRCTLSINVFSRKVLLGTLLLHLLLEMGPPFKKVTAEKRQCVHFSVILRPWILFWPREMNPKLAQPNELILLWLKNKTNKTPLPSSLNKVGLFVFWGEGRLSLHGDAIIH